MGSLSQDSDVSRQLDDPCYCYIEVVLIQDIESCNTDWSFGISAIPISVHNDHSRVSKAHLPFFFSALYIQGVQH